LVFVLNRVNCKTHVAVGTLTYIRSFLRCGRSIRFITSVADDCSTFVLVFVGGWQAGDSPAVHRHYNICLVLYPIAFYSGTALHSFTSHPVLLLYTLPDLLPDAKEGKDLARSQSADDAVPVEVSADFISENDPASSLIATSSGYAMTRTLGRTGGAIYCGDGVNSGQFTSVERPRTRPPALWHPSC
jgi:hypothetical protein